METYTTEKERKVVDTWKTKPCYQNSVIRKSDKEIAKDWMIKEFGFYMERWTITPEMAQEILDGMGTNRAKRIYGLLKYSTTLKEGNWWLSPQGIIFDETGKLIDGQHRLSAVIESGKTTDFVVFLGVKHETPIDVGMSRNSADSLRIRGELPEDLATKEIIAIANAIFYMIKGMERTYVATDEDRRDLILKYAYDFRFARQISHAGSSTPIATKAGVQAAILCASICGVDPSVLSNFASQINTGFFTDESQRAALVIRNTLLDIKGQHGKGPIKIIESMTEEAIQDYTNGFPRKRKYAGKEHPYFSKIPFEEVVGHERS